MIRPAGAPSCRDHIHQKGLGISIIVGVVLAILSQTVVTGVASTALLATGLCLPITPIILAAVKYGLEARRYRQGTLEVEKEETVTEPDALPLPAHFDKNDPRLKLVPMSDNNGTVVELPENWAEGIVQESPGVYSTLIDGRRLVLPFKGDKPIYATYLYKFIEAYKKTGRMANKNLVHVTVCSNLKNKTHPAPDCSLRDLPS